MGNSILFCLLTTTTLNISKQSNLIVSCQLNHFPYLKLKTGTFFSVQNCIKPMLIFSSHDSQRSAWLNDNSTVSVFYLKSSSLQALERSLHAKKPPMLMQLKAFISLLSKNYSVWNNLCSSSHYSKLNISSKKGKYEETMARGSNVCMWGGGNQILQHPKFL